jgi:ParB/RepB/Spo0J family partition protein
MSPEKLEELSDSIKEIGQIVPIKVRKNGEGYTLVYGHRRVMAAKAAGLKEIEAIVEDVPDDKLLTQSLAENVIREDMAAIDIAKALRLILDETGATQEALGRRLGWGESAIRGYLSMLDPDLGLAKSPARAVSVSAVEEAKAGTGGDLKLAAQVLKKAADEELSTRQTRKVAEAVAAAPNPVARKKLLEHEFDPFVHDADRIREQVRHTPGRDPVVQERQPRADADWKQSPAVADMLRRLAQIEKEWVPAFMKLIKAGKLDPAGHAFVAGRVRRVMKALEQLLAALDGKAQS